MKKEKVEPLEIWTMERFLRMENVANGIYRDYEQGNESRVVSHS